LGIGFVKKRASSLFFATGNRRIVIVLLLYKRIISCATHVNGVDALAARVITTLYSSNNRRTAVSCTLFFLNLSTKLLFVFAFHVHLA